MTSRCCPTVGSPGGKPKKVLRCRWGPETRRLALIHNLQWAGPQGAFLGATEAAAKRLVEAWSRRPRSKGWSKVVGGCVSSFRPRPAGRPSRARARARPTRPTTGFCIAGRRTFFEYTAVQCRTCVTREFDNEQHEDDVASRSIFPAGTGGCIGRAISPALVTEAEAQTAGQERRAARREGREARREGRRAGREARREGRRTARELRREAR